jgi:hypothetical protein
MVGGRAGPRRDGQTLAVDEFARVLADKALRIGVAGFVVEAILARRRDSELAAVREKKLGKARVPAIRLVLLHDENLGVQPAPDGLDGRVHF